MLLGMGFTVGWAARRWTGKATWRWATASLMVWMSIRVFDTPAAWQAIHWGTVQVLETAGLWVEDDEAIDLFADGGCKVDRSTHKVKIPSHVLEEAISWAPSTVVLCGRTPDKDVVLEGRRVTWVLTTRQYAALGDPAVLSASWTPQK